MPNRIIKESICSSETVDGLSWFEEVFFYRLIVNCDDYGRMDARPAILRSRLFPLKSVTDKQIDDALNKLATVGIATVYRYDGRPYLQLVTWENHQQIRAKRSRFPAPDNIGNQMISDDIKCPRNPIQSEYKSESKKKSSSPAFAADSDPYRAAAYLKKRILENYPSHKPIEEPQLQKWAQTIERMLRIDKRDKYDIVDVIDYAQDDEFWRANILSADKLREKYDTLIAHKARGEHG